LDLAKPFDPSVPRPTPPRSSWEFLLGTPDALIFTLRQVWQRGCIDLLLAVLTLAAAALPVFHGVAESQNFWAWAFAVPLTLLAASVLSWLLLLPVWLATVLLGQYLSGAGLAALLGAQPLLVWLLITFGKVGHKAAEDQIKERKVASRAWAWLRARFGRPVNG
jgi:hypothetical protein